MVKKQTSKQNIAIIVLAILLLLSIGFGATYAYFNASSKDTVSGSITVITMDLSLGTGTNADDNNDYQDFGSSNVFSLHQGGDGAVAPGERLNNTILKINNKCKVNVYSLIVYKLSATRYVIDENGDHYLNPDNNGAVHAVYDANNKIHTVRGEIIKATSPEDVPTTAEQRYSVRDVDTTGMNAMDIQGNVDPAVVGAGWRKVVIQDLNDEDDAENLESETGANYFDGLTVGEKIHCLVYLGDSDAGVGTGSGIMGVGATTVLDENSLKIPYDWDNEMQGVDIKLSFQAFVVTATDLNQIYNVDAEDLADRQNAIVKALFEQCNIINTVYPPVA